MKDWPKNTPIEFAEIYHHTDVVVDESDGSDGSDGCDGINSDHKNWEDTGRQREFYKKKKKNDDKKKNQA